MAEFLNQDPPETLDPFNLVGHKIHTKARQKGYDELKAIGVKGSALRWQVIANVCSRLEHDKPYEAQGEAMRAVDLTGTYRLIAVILTTEAADREKKNKKKKKKRCADAQ